MENRFDFIPGALNVNGKTFPASYENKPGRVVIVAETADDGAITIEIPETDPRFMLAYAVADETARKAAQEPEKRPETILNNETEKEEEKKMPVYEIGYDAGVCFSINMIQAPDEETARAAAEKHAARHGYSVAYVKELFAWQVKESREKGMPFETVTEKPATDPESSAPTADADAAQADPEERPETISEPAPESSADAADVADALRPVSELRKHDPEKAAKYEKLIRGAMKANAEKAAQDPAPAPEATPEASAPAPERKRPETILKASPEKPPRGPAKEKDFAGESLTGKGWSIVFDTGLNRTRVIVAEPFREKLRPMIEAAGFYYSNAQNSWNKKLTHKAHRAAVALADNLRAALA